VADLHDDPVQHGVVVAAEISKDPSHFNQIRQTFLQPVDQREGVVIPLAGLETPVADRLARRPHPRPASPYSTLTSMRP